MPLTLGPSGRLRGARFVRSPNRDRRPRHLPVTLAVIHGISLPPGTLTGNGVRLLFTNRLDPEAHPAYRGLAGLRVSAHFFVRRNGSVLQFVDCAQRAWHAGASRWRGRSRCNDFSVGIELEGTDDIRYTGAQYRTAARLIAALKRRYPIADVAGHADIAPGRKTDPGVAFSWPRLRALVRAAR
jgi:AmpD protein